MSMMIVTIPGTPPRELSPNARVHWRVRSKHTKQYRETAYLATVAATRVPFTGDGPIDLALTYAWEKGRKRMDDDNAWAIFKSGRDGVADALGFDDKRLRCVSVEQVRDPEGRGYTTVELWQEGDGDDHAG